MDSLSQLALGSAVGLTVMGRHTALWKAALWGGVVGTLPDLDAFIDHGDPIRNMTFHRAESHAFFWQTLAAPAIALGIARLQDEMDRLKRWWLAVWLVLITHALLDAMTVYGTQLGLPFTDHPFGVASIFIIDPLYTLPLLAGLAGALFARADPDRVQRALRRNAAGLVLSTAYLAWSFAVQQYVAVQAREALVAQGIEARQLLVTPTAFNTVLWRAVAMTPQGYAEGFYSLLDGGRPVRFDVFGRDTALYEQLESLWPVARMAWFTHGFFAMREQDGAARSSDLRMGQEPYYPFTFVVARRASPEWRSVTPKQVGTRGDVEALLAWTWQRLRGRDIPPPR